MARAHIHLMGIVGLLVGSATCLGSRSKSPTAEPTSQAATVSVSAARATPQAPVQTTPSSEPASVTTTPGKIRCGDRSCDLKTEVCCSANDPKEGALGRCLPREGFTSCAEGETAKKCDEIGDCDRTSLCCETYACTYGCPMEIACEQRACSFSPSGEICLPGGECSKGRVCERVDGEDHGTCRVPERAISCAGEPCDGACCWNVETKKSRCLAECPTDDASERSFGCTAPEDCPGGVCASIAASSAFACVGLAFASDRADSILCDEVSQCPPRFALAPTACEPAEDLMPGMKICRYRSAD